MTSPLVSVISPTWRREGLLTCRCIPSVQRQTYSAVEHVIVSDGPAEYDVAPPLLNDPHPGYTLVYGCLPEHAGHPHWGGPARRRGLELATGELIAYCDDDDALRRNHVALLAGALLADPDAGFAYSIMVSHKPDKTLMIGSPDPPVTGNIGTPCIMHRRELTSVATWGADSSLEDWNLVQAWLSAGVRYVHVEQPTVDVWPSKDYLEGAH